MRLRRAVLVLGALVLLLCGHAGAANPQIAGLQVALAAGRFYAGAIDGISGTATVSAVHSLQRQAGLPISGVLTQATRRALGPLGRPLFGNRPLRRGMLGWDVSVLQFLLVQRGLELGPLDGRFGPRTEAAVVSYQRQARLEPDGVVGPVTRSRLCPSPGCTSLPRSLTRTRARYRVRSGETLSEIAARHGTTTAALAEVNGIDQDHILLVGTRLRLPSSHLRAAWPEELVPVRTVKAMITRFAARAGVDPRLARALAWVESGYQANVRSSTGDWGVMQISAEAWDFVEAVIVKHPVAHATRGNIRVGITYLRHLLREFHGDERLALAAYHQGATGVRTWGVLPKTERYVANVQAAKRLQ